MQPLSEAKDVEMVEAEVEKEQPPAALPQPVAPAMPSPRRSTRRKPRTQAGAVAVVGAPPHHQQPQLRRSRRPPPRRSRRLCSCLRAARSLPCPCSTRWRRCACQLPSTAGAVALRACSACCGVGKAGRDRAGCDCGVSWLEGGQIGDGLAGLCQLQQAGQAAEAEGANR